MFRPALLAAICTASALHAEDARVCAPAPGTEDNCVRILACIGDEGMTFDGQAWGWNFGTVHGARSDGVLCDGTWDADGPFGAGVGQMSCADGLDVSVLYYSQDDLTGTAVGRGTDSLGRAVQVWSGENVLQFLTPDGADIAFMPCISGDIPIS